MDHQRKQLLSQLISQLGIEASMYRRGAALLALGVLAGGCASTTPRLDGNFGQSARAAVASQLLNPDAARNRDPVSGMDGVAAGAAHTRYLGSFATPQASDAGMLNQGGGKK